ncbi:hypothetical protein, partial [Corynebacterium aurimucosum]|uniref:hypothetical protein n=1 Tax=Corynebacterium aurimucosum TaxID=169292 RepID=UPI0031D5CF3E
AQPHVKYLTNYSSVAHPPLDSALEVSGSKSGDLAHQDVKGSTSLWCETFRQGASFLRKARLKWTLQ